mgnify:CR=1 FL=1
MAKRVRRVSRLHSKNPEDAKWRAEQSRVDSDIAGLSRDPEAERLNDEMDAAGIPNEEQIERLKAYFIARQRNRVTGST